MSCPFKDEISWIISGGALGVDNLAIQYAIENRINYAVFFPDWDTFGKSAGYKRNEEMAANADAVIILHDGKSRGTTHMWNIAKEKGLKIHYVSDH